MPTFFPENQFPMIFGMLELRNVAVTPANTMQRNTVR